MKKVKLGEICDIQAGGTPSRNKKEFWVQGNIPWVKIKDINSKYISKVEEHITELGLQFSSAKLFSRGTILYTIFATIGEVAILDIDAATNQAIAGLHLKSEKVLKDYLYFFLLSIKNRVKNDSRGVAQNNINLTYLKNIEVPIVENSIQQEICNNLTKINQIITLRNQQLIELSNLVKSRFNEMFGDIFDNPQSKLEDHTELNPNKREELLNFNGDVSFIPMANVSENGKINLSINRNIDDVRKGFTFFKDNDVIVAKITPCFENGKGAPLFGLLNGIGFGSTEFHVLRPKNTVNTVWLYHVTMLSEFRLEGERKMTGSGGQRRIPKDFISNFKLNIPPLSLQNEFADFVAQVDKSQFACGIVIKLWRNSLKSSII
ncbi:restriction endonuclease subunit S [Streptococcus oralis]|uniref:Type I restriction-modification system S subunit n=1 Tax=Streptococcus oralis TaxID=1303 RepID=A0A4V0ELM4_STROR|nr:restriction endonuclease subunit S [Streptococcus oralis]VTT09318.1 type I restriction-modification system S subunit [Streptococcus oralis]